MPAGALGGALAAWVAKISDSDALAEHHQRSRSVRRRIEPDGMVRYAMLLPPLVAGQLNAHLDAWVMRGRTGVGASADAPTVAQQHADAVADLASNGSGGVGVEVVLHVRGDGISLDDGTPVPESQLASLVPTAFMRALIHDAEGAPVNVSHRRRHPTTRQRRFVKERDRVCRDCGRADLLHYDHNPDYATSRRTTVTELELRCAPCHRRRHAKRI